MTKVKHDLIIANTFIEFFFQKMKRRKGGLQHDDKILKINVLEKRSGVLQSMGLRVGPRTDQKKSPSVLSRRRTSSKHASFIFIEKPPGEARFIRSI